MTEPLFDEGRWRYVRIWHGQCHRSTMRRKVRTQLKRITLNIIDLSFFCRGKMIPSELERLVRESFEKGNRPFFVNCTCGTTVLGAFDPINPIADICEKYNLWLHIDVSGTRDCAFSLFNLHCHSICTSNRPHGVVDACSPPSSAISWRALNVAIRSLGTLTNLWAHCFNAQLFISKKMLVIFIYFVDK